MEFDAGKLFDGRANRTTAEALRKAGMKTGAGEWLGFSLVASVACALAALATALALNAGIALSAAAAAASFALAFARLSTYPARKARKRAELVEADLPFALRTLATELSLNAPFERALESAAGYGEAGREFSRVLADVKRGHSFPRALASMGERIDSVHVRRAAAHLSFAFERGKTEGLRRLADQLTSLQREKMRKHAAKQSVLGLVFVTVGGIVPAFFGAYAVIGSAFLEAAFTPEQILLAYFAVFPLADAAILYYLKKSSPKVKGNA
ncbi:MAG: type II secretion system F family protein [Candidatus Micrarchaeia archaeon]